MSEQTYYQLSLEVSVETVLAFAESIEEHMDSISYTEIPNTDRWLLEGIRFSPVDEASLQQCIRSIASSLDAPPPLVTIQKLHQKDWLLENRKSFPALTIGSFFIHGSHIEPSTNPNHTNLLIDASVAFGTGSHETTKGCIEVLEAMQSQNMTFSNILDLGTGTGILAMVAAKLFNATVLATDIDEDAVLKAIDNIQENAFEQKIKAICSNGFQHQAIAERAPFDLIIANILAGPLIQLAPEITRKICKGGSVLLSGLLTTQRKEVEFAYTQNGFKVIHQGEYGDWSVLHLKKGD